MKRHPDAQRALGIAAGLVIVALTAAAFWLSYAHLAEVAATYGLESSPVRAWAWPATLDLFIVAGELLMLRAALTKDVDPWAIGLTVVGSGGSIALNVAGVGSAAQPLDYVVAAVPPTAALLAFGALMRQVHQALAGTAEAINVDVIHVETSTESPVPAAYPAPEYTQVRRTPDAPEAVTVSPMGDMAAVETPAPYPALPEGVPAAYPAADQPEEHAVPAPQDAVPAVPEQPVPAQPEYEPEYTPNPDTPLPVLGDWSPLLPLPAGYNAAVPATAPRAEVHAEYVPDDDTEDDLVPRARTRFADLLADGRTPSIRSLRDTYSIGQPRAQRIQKQLGGGDA